MNICTKYEEDPSSERIVIKQTQFGLQTDGHTGGQTKLNQYTLPTPQPPEFSFGIFLQHWDGAVIWNPSLWLLVYRCIYASLGLNALIKPLNIW